MCKIKTFSHSQPGVCSWHVLKILVNLSLNVLIKKVLIKKKSVLGTEGTGATRNPPLYFQTTKKFAVKTVGNFFAPRLSLLLSPPVNIIRIWHSNRPGVCFIFIA